MLSIKNIVKTYKTKGGAQVRALDGVTIDFPERGMVFLLGKSGSGKSTLLNVAGGLDIPDSGEIIVKGSGSRDFTPSDFDSYRNTYVGFIFQEYNILNEYNVEQNISLALQLQGKKNDTAAVNAILEQVELTGLGHRKPLTLSGGQKQRVAIARALIKEPEIIMADEPTGALDSKTGKDVLETLKKLSAHKLVIIVSHDVEFAEMFGDRIIELKDGKVISDTSKNYIASASVSENIRIIDDKTISIKKHGKLTDEEKSKVLELLENNCGNGEIILSANEKKVENFKKANRITEDGSQEYFADTKPENIQTKKYTGNKAEFIKSSLPLKHAVKIGANSLKAKPVRLVITIFVSFLAFGLFGVVSTMMMYDVNYTAAKALEGTSYHTAVLQKYYITHYTNTSYELYDGKERVVTNKYDSQYTTAAAPSELENLHNKSLGVNFAGIFNPDGRPDLSGIQINNYAGTQYADYYSFDSFCGLTDAGEQYLTGIFGNDICLAGSYPDEPEEIAISEYMYEVFKYKGLKAYNITTKNYDSSLWINSPSDLIGKYIGINSIFSSDSLNMRISGVYKAGFIDRKYDALKPGENNSALNNDELRTEFFEVNAKGFHNLGYVSDSFYENKKINFDYEDYQNTMSRGTAHFRSYNPLTSQFEYSYLEYTLPEGLEEYSDNVLLYSFADGSALPASSIKSIGKNETFIGINNLYERAITLYNSHSTWYPSTYYYLRTENKEFVSAYNKLRYFLGNNWDGEESQKPADRNISENDIKTIIAALNADWDTWVKNGDYDKLYYGNSGYLKITGVYVLKSYSNSCLVNESFISENSTNYNYTQIKSQTNYVEPANGKYTAIITPMETTMNRLNYILKLNKAAADDSYFEITNNSIYSNASSAGWMFKEFTWIFILAGVALAIISALFLLNYISISIVDKSREIGILRAVGARGTDVFKIFFAESFIITSICTVLAIIAAVISCIVINTILSWSVFSYQLLNFNIINGLIIFGIALFVAFAATILPVYRAAKKAPVDSIRSL